MARSKLMWAPCAALLLWSGLAYGQDGGAPAAEGDAPAAEGDMPAPETLAEEPVVQGDVEAMGAVEGEGTTPVVVAAAPVTPARDRKFALGAAQTLAGVRGFEAQMRLGKVVLEGVLGFARYSPENGNATTGLGFAAGVFYRWKTPPKVSLLVGGRLAFAYSGVAGSGGVEGGSGDSNTDVYIEAPLRIEIELSDRLSVHGEAGPLMSFVEQSMYVPGGSVQGTSTRFGISGGGLVAGFGFSWAL